MIDSSFMPHHRPLVKLHFASSPFPLPLCTWATANPQKRPQYRNTTHEPDTLEAEKFQEQREIADHLPEKKTQQRNTSFPRSSVTSEMGITAMVHPHQARPLGIVGNSPPDGRGVPCLSVWHPLFQQLLQDGSLQGLRLAIVLQVLNVERCRRRP